MKKIRKFIIIAGLVSMVLQPVIAGEEEMTLAEYQSLMVKYTILIGAEDLTSQMEALPEEAWQILYDATPSKWLFAETVIKMDKQARNTAAKAEKAFSNSMSPQSIPLDNSVEGEFKPRYPAWDGTYGVFMYPSFYLFVDTDEGGYQDDRTNEDAEAIAKGAHILLHGLAITAQAAADMSFAGAEAIFGAAAGVAWGLDYASEEILAAGEFQTGNVDGAEIEAAYENTRTILNEVNEISAIFDDETNFIDDDELAIHETAIKSAIATNGMETRGAISTHDKEIKAQLAVINKKLSEQQAQLDEIIRLLNTPQGKRPSWNK